MEQDEEQVVLSLIDFKPKNYGESSYELQLLKSKLMSNEIKRYFSMNLEGDPIVEIPIEYNGSYDLKISYRFECILVCCDRKIIVKDRKSFKDLNIINLPNGFVNLTISDEYDEIYMILYDSNHTYICYKYVLSEWLKGLQSELWSSVMDDYAYGIATMVLDGERVVLTDRISTCNDYTPTGKNAPISNDVGSIEPISDTEVIFIYQARLMVCKRDNKEWVNLSEYNLPKSVYAIVYDRKMRNIYVSFLTELQILHIDHNYNITLQKSKICDASGVFLDRQLGRLGVAHNKTFKIYE